ncbi:Hpt domain-containing protein [Roseobacter ponti]|uniref:Hpt domain-containing protein n=1 Tax=Roseobacter ponti TaxID=1891787 RepID=A0A858SLY7_9RHOB|nr:Hpt domain-containing protein [Roseobacter ponti]QJF49745.1 Hpt domain-containing protein [Roseobacter ponti]
MIDWDRVCALQSEVGAEDFDEVIELFLEEVDGEIDGLPGSPRETLAERLHFLKGSALNLGFRKFSELCRDGESKVAGSDTVDVPGLVACYQQSRAYFLNEVAERTSDQSKL